MDYLVKSASFEGPIHILLNLIQERKLHVSEVSLAAVTEDFMNYISSHDLSYSDISAFISTASTLLLIKSRSLLPALELTEEEEESIEDLTERVRQYEVIQRYAGILSPYYLKNPIMVRTHTQTVSVFAPDAQMNVDQLGGYLSDILEAFPVVEKLPEKTVRLVIKLEERIEELKHRIQAGMTIHSKEIMDRYRNASDPTEKRQAKVFAVVSFLAILELVKKGFAQVLQQENFSDIELHNRPVEAEPVEVID